MVAYMSAAVALDPGLTGTVEVLRAIDELLDQHAGGDVIEAAAASSALGAVDRGITRLQAVRRSWVAEADRSAVAVESGMTGTGAWLAARTRREGGQAARDVRLATALDHGLDATREALAAGDVSTEHAMVIATATAQLPQGLGADERTAIETAMVRRAKLVDPGTLRRDGRRALAAVERSQAEVDAHEDRVLRTQEDVALAKSRLTWHQNGDGTTSGHFTLPSLAAAILVKTVQQIASPRRFAQQAAKAARAAGATTAAEVADATWDAFRAADGDWAHRYGSAFVELLEHLPTDALSGKVAATVVVTVAHDQLKAALGAAHLDTGHDLSASEARRLACNAGIVPAVLGGRSVPIDLGRQERFFTEAQRVSLATVYDTCAAQGCDRPYAWSELHHEDPWASGGHTDLELAVPLCGHHHRMVHDPRYRHRVDTDARGKKSVLYSLRS
jgi:hypothetical protein